MNRFLDEISEQALKIKIYWKKDQIFFQKLDFKWEVKMVETVNDLILKTRDETDQIRVKGTLMKVTKKSINIFVWKK